MVLSADQKTITVANLNSRLSYAFRKAFNETYDQNSGYNSSQGESVSFIFYSSCKIILIIRFDLM